MTVKDTNSLWRCDGCGLIIGRVNDDNQLVIENAIVERYRCANCGRLKVWRLDERIERLIAAVQELREHWG